MSVHSDRPLEAGKRTPIVVEAVLVLLPAALRATRGRDCARESPARRSAGHDVDLRTLSYSQGRKS